MTSDHAHSKIDLDRLTMFRHRLPCRPCLGLSHSVVVRTVLLANENTTAGQHAQRRHRQRTTRTQAEPSAISGEAL